MSKKKLLEAVQAVKQPKIHEIELTEIQRDALNSVAAQIQAAQARMNGHCSSIIKGAGITIPDGSNWPVNFSQDGTKLVVTER